MRTFLKAIICMILMLVVFPIQASAAEEITIKGETVEIDLGEKTVDVPVMISANSGFATGQIDMSWDYESLTLKKIVFGITKDYSSAVIGTGINKEYTVQFGDDTATEDNTDTGILFTATFEISDEAKAGDYEIVLAPAEEDMWTRADFEQSVGSISAENAHVVIKSNIVSRTVRFDSNGGSAVAEQTVEEGGYIIKPEDPKREGFIFLGWYLGDDPFDFNTEITSNIELRAKWEEEHKHVMEYHEAQDATCEEEGNTEYWYCTSCEKYFTDEAGKEETTKEAVSLESLGHAWGEWETETPATALEDGLEVRYCQNNSEHRETRVLKYPYELPLIHVEGKDATCEEDGNLEYWKTKDDAHMFWDETGIDEVEAQEDLINPAFGHALTKTDAVDPTCSKEGNIDYWTCDTCGKIFSDEDGKEEITIEDTVLAKVDHQWSDWEITKEATETEKGTRERTCSVGGEKETEEYGPIDHVHKLVKTDKVEATCEKNGTEEYWTCSSCDKIFSDENGENELKEPVTIPATGHKWDEGKVTEEPTCTEKGVKTFTCENDSSHTKAEDIDALGHDFGEWTVVKEATCLEEGSEERKCSRCEEKETRSIGKKEHNWSEWIVTKEATFTEDGEETRTCSVGHETETRSIDKLTMEKVDAKAAVCEEDGNTEYYKGSNGKYYKDAEGKEEISLEDTVVSKLGHDYGEWTVTKEPTCKEEGVETRTCSHDASHTETRPVAKVDHTWGEWTTVKEATEDEEGQEKRICSVCNEEETRAIPVLPHTHVLVKVEAKAATCTEDGNIEYWTCEKDGFKFADENGETQLNDEDVVVKALGHEYGEWAVTKEPSCLEEGEETRTCSHDSSHTETRPVAKLDHNWSEWTVVKEATEDEEGEEERTCSVSGEKETRSIDKLPHTKHTLEKVEAKDPTCTASGNKEYYTCTKCGKIFLDENGEQEGTISAVTIAALGHDWSDWKVTKEATETETGMQERTCKNDASHKETQTIPKKVPEVIAYKIIEGANSTYVMGADDYIVVVSNAPFEKFVKVIVDGSTLDPDEYYPTEGSTRILLKTKYLKKTAIGEHSITIQSTDGEASTKFYILEYEKKPENQAPSNNKDNSGNSQKSSGKKATRTYESNWFALWMSVLIVSLGIAGSVIAFRKKNNG